MQKYNVICIKWGTAYKADDVNKLCSMIKRNTKCEIDFYCFTDNSVGLRDDVIVKPLPQFENVKKVKKNMLKNMLIVKKQPYVMIN